MSKQWRPPVGGGEAIHKAWYAAYLRSPEWRGKRERVLARDGGKCRGCLGTAGLQVHHLHYERVGDEPLGHLLTLCDNCHAFWHRKKCRAVNAETYQRLRSFRHPPGKRWWRGRVSPFVQDLAHRRRPASCLKTTEALP